MQLATRTISTTTTACGEALTEVPSEGDVDGLISEIDRIISSTACTAKEVADAAVALTYLQAKGARRWVLACTAFVLVCAAPWPRLA